MTVSKIDLGLQRILKNFHTLENSVVKVGFPKGKDTKPADNTKLKSYSDISEVASVAFFNEYGTKDIPERPFMRPMFTEGNKELTELKTSLYKKLTRGELTVKTYYNLLGLWGKKFIQNKIVSIRTPENSDKTIEIKGFDNPLIWSGQMKNSVQHEVIIR
jgi:hypothetical protein